MNLREKAARRERAVAAVRAGVPVAEAAEAEGLRASTLYLYCQEAGVRPPRKVMSPLRDTSYRVLARLWDLSLTQQEIAAEFGVTKQAVSSIYRKARAAGIPVPERAPGGNAPKPREVSLP